MKITEGLGRALFFVVGVPKSGTTWVQLMLTGHAAIDCAGEGHFTDWLLEDVRGLLAKYNERQAFNNAFVYDDDGYFSGFTGKDFNALARFVFFQKLRKRDLKPAIRFQGDKTPNYVYALNWLREIFPEARFIYVMRDGRDAAASIIDQKMRLLRAETHRPYDTRTRRSDLESFVRKWLEVTQLARDFDRAWPNRMITLRYETLIRDPHKEIARAVRFLGAGHDVNQIAACVAHGALEKWSGGRAPGEADPDSFFRKGVTGDWLEFFSDDEQDYLTARLGKRLAEIGYRA